MCYSIPKQLPRRAGEGREAPAMAELSTAPQRSRAIEFYRFLFSVVVCLFHFRIKGSFAGPTGAFSAGYLGVEFFSIASGFFLMDSIRRGRAASDGGTAVSALVGSYAVRRFLRLWPHYLLTLSAFVSMRIFFLRTLTVEAFLKQGFFEIFLLQSFGSSYVVMLFWYVSALLLASVLLYWLGLALRDHLPLLALFTAPLILSLFYQHYGTVDHTTNAAIAGSLGLWRVAAGLGLGCAARCLTGQPRRRTPLRSLLWEVGLLLALALIINRTYHSPWDFISILPLTLLVSSVFRGNSPLSRLLDNPLSALLGKISYGFYLNQCFFLHLFGPVIPVRSYWPTAVLYLLLNLLLSALTTALCQWLTVRIPPLFARILSGAERSPMSSPPASGQTRPVGAARGLFAVGIGLYHGRSQGEFGQAPTAFLGGYLGVEFFTLISGYFLMRTIQRGQAARAQGEALLPMAGSFALQRYLRLYPHYILTLVPFLLMRVFVLRTLTPSDCLTDGFFDLLMLQSFGFPSVVYLLWYSSALFLSSVLLYWLALVLQDHFLPAISFAAPLLLSAYLQYYGSVDQTMFFAAVGSRGLWRLAAELGLGCLLFCLVKRFAPLFHRRFAAASTAAELALLAVILPLCWRCNRDERDFLVLALMFLLAASIFWGNSWLSRLLDNRVSAFLGKISYGFYLNQCFFLHLFGPVIPVRSYWSSAAVFLAGNLLLSALTCYLSQALAALFQKRLGKMQNAA